MLLPDVNVWLALTFDSHFHHPAAKSWFDGLSNDVCYFCRLTQQGFLRLATNRSVFGKDAVTLPDAWQKYDLFLKKKRKKKRGRSSNDLAMSIELRLLFFPLNEERSL